MYNYGEEISYNFDLLKVEDYDNLQPFECTNERLDRHIKQDVIKDTTKSLSVFQISSCHILLVK